MRHARNIFVAEQIRITVGARPLVIRVGTREIGGVHMQRQVRPLAALDGCVAGVEVAAQDLRERIGSPPRRGAFFGGVVDRIPGFGQRGECGQEHFAGHGVEVTFDRDAAVEGFRGVEFVAFGVFAGWEFVGFEDPLEPGDAGADGRGGRVGPAAASSNTFRHESNASFGIPRGGDSQNFPINEACSAEISPALNASAISGCRLSILPNASMRAAAGTSSNVFAASHCLTLRKPRVSNETARWSISATATALRASRRSISRDISITDRTRSGSTSRRTSAGCSAVAAMPELLSPPGFMTRA
ncbi:hypothetical protein A5905_06385 [Prescottella equi]|nr:hypothetical protein A5905_06385 [Prescottella equi]